MMRPGEEDKTCQQESIRKRPRVELPHNEKARLSVPHAGTDKTLELAAQTFSSQLRTCSVERDVNLLRKSSPWFAGNNESTDRKDHLGPVIPVADESKAGNLLDDLTKHSLRAQVNDRYPHSKDLTGLASTTANGLNMAIAEDCRLAQTSNRADGSYLTRSTLHTIPTTQSSKHEKAAAQPLLPPQTVQTIIQKSQKQAASPISVQSLVQTAHACLNSISQINPPISIKWKGPGDTPQLCGQKCPICKMDLACDPEGLGYKPVCAPVAVLPCCHVFHDHCLLLITPEDQSKCPPCIPCAIGDISATQQFSDLTSDICL